MEKRFIVRFALTCAMAGSVVATALLLLVLGKAAIDGQLVVYPGRVVVLCLFIVLFVGFGIFNAVLYRRLGRGELQAGGPVE